MRGLSARTQIIGGILITLSIGFIVIIILRYFGILSFPPKSSVRKPFIPEPTSLSCPLEQTPCPGGEAIENSPIIANFYGLGYILPANTKILSIISGEYTVRQEQTGSGDNRTIVMVSNSKDNMEVRYIFQGLPSAELESEGIIDKGKVIGTLEGKSLGEKDFGKNYNLVIAAENLQDRQYLKLQFRE